MRRTLLLAALLPAPLFALLLALFFATPPSSAQSDEPAAIRAVMEAQTAAWNRADIPAFMKAYEDSPETTFVGTTVRKGYEPVLKHYQQAYSNAAQMGKLTFSQLDVRLLPNSSGNPEFAIVTGRFHLDRTEKGAAKQDDGIFSLVWHRTAQGWKIILDHTS